MHVPLLNSHFSARAVGKRLPRVLRSTRLAHMHTRTHAQLTTTTTTTTMMMMIMTTLTLYLHILKNCSNKPSLGANHPTCCRCEDEGARDNSNGGRRGIATENGHRRGRVCEKRNRRQGARVVKNRIVKQRKSHGIRGIVNYIFKFATDFM